ncbi:MAG TPA: MSHA biogenesis protein MshJ [Pseudomonas sp.]|jgi:MSHA biogenesis protein MshJ|nr:MSHA biogenesis protein MshJ [Pseudomonas sp.]
MNTDKWLQRWRALAPREQWLAYGVGLALCGLLYVQFVGTPIAARFTSQTTDYQAVEARSVATAATLAKLHAALEADPNIPYNRALLLASSDNAKLLEQIDHSTGQLISPDKMRAVLQDLLKAQTGLQLVSLESFTTPVELSSIAATKTQTPASALLLYRHGVHLKLEGGYFELLRYLQAVQGTQWKLNWDSLDYRVGEAGAAHAQISLQLYTLSRYAGWIGV